MARGELLNLSGKDVWESSLLMEKRVWVQFSSVAQSCLTLCNPMDCSTQGLPVHHQLPKLTQTQFHWIGDAIQLPSSVISFSSHLQYFLASGSFPVSQFFTSGGQSIESFIISLSNEYSGLISFRMDWLDLLAVQGTLKSLLQHHSSKEYEVSGKNQMTFCRLCPSMCLVVWDLCNILKYMPSWFPPEINDVPCWNYPGSFFKNKYLAGKIGPAEEAH